MRHAALQRCAHAQAARSGSHRGVYPHRKIAARAAVETPSYTRRGCALVYGHGGDDGTAGHHKALSCVVDVGRLRGDCYAATQLQLWLHTSTSLVPARAQTQSNSAQPAHQTHTLAVHPTSQAGGCVRATHHSSRRSGCRTCAPRSTACGSSCSCAT